MSAFIVFEGGEGVGKTTQLARLTEYLRGQGLEPVVTREPGGTPEAEAIRALVLDPAHALLPMTQALLMTAARVEHVTHVVRPARQAAKLVLCDRFIASTLIYQGAAGGVDQATLGRLHDLALDGLMPDVTLVLDADPDIGLARRGQAGGGNRFEQQNLAFHRRVRDGFLALAHAEPERYAVIDAAQEPERVETAIRNALRARLPDVAL